MQLSEFSPSDRHVSLRTRSVAWAQGARPFGRWLLLAVGAVLLNACLMEQHYAVIAPDSAVRRAGSHTWHFALAEELAAEVSAAADADGIVAVYLTVRSGRNNVLPLERLTPTILIDNRVYVPVRSPTWCCKQQGARAAEGLAPGDTCVWSGEIGEVADKRFLTLRFSGLNTDNPDGVLDVILEGNSP